MIFNADDLEIPKYYSSNIYFSPTKYFIFNPLMEENLYIGVPKLTVAIWLADKLMERRFIG